MSKFSIVVLFSVASLMWNFRNAVMRTATIVFMMKAKIINRLVVNLGSDADRNFASKPQRMT